MYQIHLRVNICGDDFFFIAFHYAAQAIPIILLIDDKASKLKHELKQLLNCFLFYFNHFESCAHAS